MTHKSKEKTICRQLQEEFNQPYSTCLNLYRRFGEEEARAQLRKRAQETSLAKGSK